MPNQKKSYFLNNMKMFFQLRNFLRPAAQIHNLQSKKKKKDEKMHVLRCSGLNILLRFMHS